MSSTYKINLYNLQQSTQTMWCFLGEQDIKPYAPVYANSNTFLMVPPFNNGTIDNSFTIPLQYVIQAGASNNPVELNTRISTNASQYTDLGMEWLASYFPEPSRRYPELRLEGTTSNNQLVVATNSYNKVDESINSWYGSMTYGMEYTGNLIGLTWSPEPNFTYQIKPRIAFYVAIGSFESDTLVDINMISRESALVTEYDFNENNECTVIRHENGSWSIRPGNQPPSIFSK